MRDEFLNGEIFYSLKEAQALIENWRKEYNHFIPHSSLGYRAPVPLAILPSYDNDGTSRAYTIGVEAKMGADQMPNFYLDWLPKEES